MSEGFPVKTKKEAASYLTIKLCSQIFDWTSRAPSSGRFRQQRPPAPTWTKVVFKKIVIEINIFFQFLYNKQLSGNSKTFFIRKAHIKCV